MQTTTNEETLKEKVMINPDMSRGEVSTICQENNLTDMETLFVMNANGILWEEEISLNNAKSFVNLLSVIRGFSQAFMFNTLKHTFLLKSKKIDKICSSYYEMLLACTVNPAEFYGQFGDMEEEHLDMVIKASNNNFSDFQFTPEFLGDVVSNVPFFSGYILFMTDYYKKIVRKDLTPMAIAKKTATAVISYMGEIVPNEFFKLSRFLEKDNSVEKSETLEEEKK